MAAAKKATEKAPHATTLDEVNGDPSVTAPGDGPADTTDPSESGSTIVAPVPSEEAIKVGTVNAIQPTGDRPAGNPEPASSDKARVEKYKATKPDGSEVTGEHNLDTGESRPD